MNDHVRRLLHRWLVEYNPLYLLSASLCLGGMFAMSRELAHEQAGVLAVAGIAELYACLLIGGAALLMRIGQRRPAVMLAVLTAVYQCDLTLHTEACACLGTVGVVASAAWLAFFLLKLRALAWAVRLRVPALALLLLAVGATGIAALPHVIGDLSERGSSAVVSAWLGALCLLAQYGGERLRITSTAPLDAWGQTVLRRATAAVWGIFAVLLLLHVGFWSLHSQLTLRSLLPLATVLATRWLSREGQVWAVTGGMVLLVAVAAPAFLSGTAMVAALTLAARAWQYREIQVLPQERACSPMPYRMGEEVLSGMRVTRIVERSCSHAAQGRLHAGAIFGIYLAAWTADFTGGAWPAHVLALDLLLVAAVLALALLARMRSGLVPLVVGAIVAAVRSGVLPHPTTTLGWGALAVITGFGLLVSSLGASYVLREGPATSGRGDGGT
ncbi:MAG: hypothetical protein JWP97_5441 [Labilithrix sp.]|nr:hypothetical protein [Labilithrix sp.]